MNGKQQQPKIWVAAIGFEGLYECSDQGRIKSLIGKGKPQERILRPAPDHKGYRTVSIIDLDGIQRSKRLARLILCSFHPYIDPTKTVNHINGNKADDELINLEWVTPSENMLHAYRTGLHKLREKFSPADQMRIYERQTEVLNMRKVAREFQTSHSVISRIIKKYNNG